MAYVFALVVTACSLVVVNCQDPIVKIRETQPEFFVDANSQKVVQGILSQDVTLDCFVEYLPADLPVEWRRKYGEGKAEQLSKDKSVEDNIRYGIEKPTPNTWRLRLRAITEQTAGLFECFVTVNHQTQKYENVYVGVFQPPEIKRQDTSNDMTATEGEPVTLRCNAIGIPKPTIEWSRQGGKLLPSPNNREKYIGTELKISTTQADDRGNYRCRAFNIIGMAHATINLDVKFQPKVQALEPELAQKIGYRIELQCIIEANPPPRDEQLRWLRDDRTFSVTSGRYRIHLIRGAFDRLIYELIIDGVESGDFGTYRCKASNSRGESEAVVYLGESNTPRDSVKLGQPITGGSSSIWSFVSLVVLSSLVAALMQHL